MLWEYGGFGLDIVILSFVFFFFFYCIIDRSYWIFVYMFYIYEWGVCVFEREVMGF